MLRNFSNISSFPFLQSSPKFQPSLSCISILKWPSILSLPPHYFQFLIGFHISLAGKFSWSTALIMSQCYAQIWNASPISRHLNLTFTVHSICPQPRCNDSYNNLRIPNCCPNISTNCFSNILWTFSLPQNS